MGKKYKVDSQLLKKLPEGTRGKKLTAIMVSKITIFGLISLFFK
jgi:hypothetical protein